MLKNLYNYVLTDSVKIWINPRQNASRIINVMTETQEVGGPPTQVLGYQLTLFAPRGAGYAPPHLFGRCGVFAGAS